MCLVYLSRSGEACLACRSQIFLRPALRMIVMRLKSSQTLYGVLFLPPTLLNLQRLWVNHMSTVPSTAQQVFPDCQYHQLNLLWSCDRAATSSKSYWRIVTSSRSFHLHMSSDSASASFNFTMQFVSRLLTFALVASVRRPSQQVSLYHRG